MLFKEYISGCKFNICVYVVSCGRFDVDRGIYLLVYQIVDDHIQRF